MRPAIAAVLCAALGVVSLGTAPGTSPAAGFALLGLSVALGAVAAGRALRARQGPAAVRLVVLLVGAMASFGAVLFLIAVSRAE